MYGRGFMGDFLGQMFDSMARVEEAQRKKDAGITDLDGLEGIERLGIPHKYYTIKINADGYLFCFTRYIDRESKINPVEVYSKDGRFLFEADHVIYYGQERFLAGKKKPVIIVGKEREDDFGYALYHNDIRLSEPVFTRHGDTKFNEFGYATIGTYGDFFGTKVIDRDGKVIIKADKDLRDIYIYGVICSTNRNYINLLTGEVICEKGYGTIYSKEFIFTQVEENCVYQINRNTGEHTIHGEAPKKKAQEQSPPNQKHTPKIAEPKIKVPQRNEPCLCGSGKKYKHCCMNKNESL